MLTIQKFQKLFYKFYYYYERENSSFNHDLLILGHFQNKKHYQQLHCNNKNIFTSNESFQNVNQINNKSILNDINNYNNIINIINIKKDEEEFSEIIKAIKNIINKHKIKNISLGIKNNNDITIEEKYIEGYNCPKYPNHPHCKNLFYQNLFNE